MDEKSGKAKEGRNWAGKKKIITVALEPSKVIIQGQSNPRRINKKYILEMSSSTIFFMSNPLVRGLGGRGLSRPSVQY